MPLDSTTTSGIYTVTTPPVPPVKFAGMVISLSGRQFRFSAFEPLAGEELEVGVFVSGVTSALGVTTVTKPTTTGAKILGFTYLNWQRPLVWDEALGTYKYTSGHMVSLLEEGDTVAYSEVAVNVGDDVFFRYGVDAGLTRIGALSNVAGTGKDPVARARFLEKTSAPGLVRISLPDII